MVVLYCLLEIVAVFLAIVHISIIIKNENEYEKRLFVAIGLAVVLFVLAFIEMKMEMKVQSVIHIIVCSIEIFIGLVSFCKMKK